jgi:hypothetical protein
MSGRRRWCERRRRVADVAGIAENLDRRHRRPGNHCRRSPPRTRSDVPATSSITLSLPMAQPMRAGRSRGRCGRRNCARSGSACRPRRRRRAACHAATRSCAGSAAGPCRTDRSGVKSIGHRAGLQPRPRPHDRDQIFQACCRARCRNSCAPRRRRRAAGRECRPARSRPRPRCRRRSAHAARCRTAGCMNCGPVLPAWTQRKCVLPSGRLVPRQVHSALPSVVTTPRTVENDGSVSRVRPGSVQT